MCYGKLRSNNNKLKMIFIKKNNFKQMFYYLNNQLKFKIFLK